MVAEQGAGDEDNIVDEQGDVAEQGAATTHKRRYHAMDVRVAEQGDATTH